MTSAARCESELKLLCVLIIGSLTQVNLPAQSVKIYVPNEAANTVSVIDATTDTVVATVPVEGQRPRGLAVTPDRRFLYTANANTDDVSVIDLRTRKLVAKIDIGHAPENVILSRDGKRLYVTNETREIAQLTIIDTSTNRVITAIPVGQESEGLVFSPDGKRLYVANEVENTTSVVDLVRNQV